MIIWWLLACAGPPPELVAQKTALEQWEAAKTSLEAHDPNAALVSLDAALSARSADPLLMAWKAKALADAGRLDEAIDLADAALRIAPSAAELRYNRAAWLARAGRPDEAGPELATALQSGLDARALRVDEDPDFTPYADHPAFRDVIPHFPFQASAILPEGAVFRGSEFAYRILIAGAGDGPVLTTVASVTGPLELVGVVEDRVMSTDGELRDITWRFIATGAGDIAIGPMTLTSGPRLTEVGVAHIDAKAPPGKEQAMVPAPDSLPTVEQAMAGLMQPVAVREGSLLRVAALAADQIQIDPVPAKTPVRLDLKLGGQPVSVGWLYRDVAPGAEVRIVRAGATVWEGTL